MPNKHGFSPNSACVGLWLQALFVFLQVWKNKTLKIKISHLESHDYLPPNSKLEAGQPLLALRVLNKTYLEDRVGK